MNTKLETAEELCRQHMHVVDRLSGDDQMTDVFSKMWQDQLVFLKILVGKGKLPSFPIDTKSKSGQQILRDLLRDGEDELGEARLVLKNSKQHRSTEFKEFDRDHFVEEVVDALKYCLGALIFAGITIDEFVAAFQRKTHVNKQRQDDGY